MNRRMLYFILIMMISGHAIEAQSVAEWQQVDQDHYQKTRTGMKILGGWGLANTIVGGIGMSRGSGENYYFQQMNLIWGTINLAIAGSNLLLVKPPSHNNIAGAIRDQQTTEKIFLFNAGLDLVYLTAGAYCIERSRHDRQPLKYSGYGKSLLLQGGALLIFDISEYLLHRSDGKKLMKLLEHVQVAGNSASLLWKF